MASEGWREEGAEPRSPGRVARSCPALPVLPRGSPVRLAPGHGEPAGSPSLSQGTPTAPTSPFLLPSCLCHTERGRARARIPVLALQLAGAWRRGAVGWELLG